MAIRLHRTMNRGNETKTQFDDPHLSPSKSKATKSCILATQKNVIPPFRRELRHPLVPVAQRQMVKTAGLGGGSLQDTPKTRHAMIPTKKPRYSSPSLLHCTILHSPYEASLSRYRYFCYEMSVARCGKLGG